MKTGPSLHLPIVAASSSGTGGAVLAQNAAFNAVVTEAISRWSAQNRLTAADIAKLQAITYSIDAALTTALWTSTLSRREPARSSPSIA